MKSDCLAEGVRYQAEGVRYQAEGVRYQAVPSAVARLEHPLCRPVGHISKIGGNGKLATLRLWDRNVTITGTLIGTASNA